MTYEIIESRVPELKNRTMGRKQWKAGFSYLRCQRGFGNKEAVGICRDLFTPHSGRVVVNKMRHSRFLEIQCNLTGGIPF